MARGAVSERAGGKQRGVAERRRIGKRTSRSRRLVELVAESGATVSTALFFLLFLFFFSVVVNQHVAPRGGRGQKKMIVNNQPSRGDRLPSRTPPGKSSTDRCLIRNIDRMSECSVRSVEVRSDTASETGWSRSWQQRTVAGIVAVTQSLVYRHTQRLNRNAARREGGMEGRRDAPVCSKPFSIYHWCRSERRSRVE